MSILYVMAAPAEYGAHLAARIKPLICGIGPVEAAISLTKALSELAIDGKLPKLVVSLGSAGSRSLQQCEVYQADTVSYRDMDASALGFPKGQTPLLDLPPVLPLGLPLPGVPQVHLSTGADVVSGIAYAAIDADMVDMETYALMRSCQSFGVPLIALRGISDGVAELSGLTDWTQYLHIIDEKLALIVDQIETLYAAGNLP